MTSIISPYLAVISARFRTLLQYRAAAFAGVVTQLFFGYIRIMIFAAFFRSSTAPQPMTYQQVISYIWLSQALLLLAMFGVEPDIAAMIRTGNVGYELARPVDLYGLWFCRCFSARVAPLLLRALPIVLIAGLFLDLQPPASAAAGAVFLLSISLSALLASAMATLLTISLMWTVSGEGITRTAPAFVFFFSGMIIPLPLFPAWSQPFIHAMPFRGLVDTPFRIYTGNMPLSEATWAMVQQASWIAALIILGRWTVSRGTSRVVVQGG
jgi:ABC-2 type transport system permease protein